jgi:predicted  nucleic acid-binding Zn-ribbon protein
MASVELRHLWQLHEIDQQILEIRARAAALDPGKAIHNRILQLQKELEGEAGEAKRLNAELKDIELAQKAIDAKLKKIDNDLYGGKVVNPREVENLQKEIEILKKQRAGHDERILEIWERMPEAEALANKVNDELTLRKADLAAAQKAAVEQKQELETAFKQANAARPAAVQKVNPSLLAKYDAIRQKHQTGMAKITKKHTCSACGLSLATKVVEIAKEDKVVTCEQCHRILYYTEGLI